MRCGVEVRNLDIVLPGRGVKVASRPGQTGPAIAMDQGNQSGALERAADVSPEVSEHFTRKTCKRARPLSHAYLLLEQELALWARPLAAGGSMQEAAAEALRLLSAVSRQGLSLHPRTWALWKCQRHVGYLEPRLGGVSGSTVEVPPLHADKLLGGPLRRGSTAWAVREAGGSMQLAALAEALRLLSAVSRQGLGLHPRTRSRVLAGGAGLYRVGAVRRCVEAPCAVPFVLAMGTVEVPKPATAASG